MRRTALALVAVAALATAAVPATAGAATGSPSASASVSITVTVASPDEAKAEIIELLTAVACPTLAAQAAPVFQPLVEAQCAAILASPDPVGAATTFLPLLCAGDPPFGALVFPQYAPLFTTACPVVNGLPPLPTLPPLPRLPLLGGLL
jgi:hypothetical protein